MANETNWDKIVWGARLIDQFCPKIKEAAGIGKEAEWPKQATKSYVARK